MTSKCMVVLSGGQDSTTCLYSAKQTFDEVHAVSFDYGQKHSIELAAAATIGHMAQVKSHQFIDVKGLLHSRSPLLDATAELERYQSFQQMDAVIGDRVELTFVPMRNMFFLVMAANRAIEMDIRDLYTGVCQADNANYPDCRETFVQQTSMAISLALGLDKAGMGPLFHIHTPLMHMSKAESIQLAVRLPGCMEALAYSHTAYDGRYPPTGNDHASMLRAHGFEEAGLPDPLVVRAWREGLMDLPMTANYQALHNVSHP